MGVNHLSGWASKAQSAKAPTNKPVSQQTTRSTYNRPAETSGTRQVPVVGKDSAFSRGNLRTGDNPAQPPKGNANGGRGGAKSGQPKVGGPGGRPGMSGGRLG